MKIIAHNNGLVITDALSIEISRLSDMLSYTDKSKQYQARRMERNRWTPKILAEQVAASAEGCLLKKIDDNTLFVPPGFAPQLVIDEDVRCDTGITISLPWAKQPPDMRPYQDEAVSAMMEHWRGIVNMGTGLGKTLTTVHFLRKLKRKALIVCPSSAIANGFYDELCAAFGKNRIGFLGGGKKKIGDITVGIAQSVVNNIDALAAHDLGVVVFDETHRIAADTFYQVAEKLAHVGRMYGLTATSFRSDGKDIFLTAGVGDVIIKRDAKWGIENGWLANPVFVMREVMTFGTDFKDDKLKNYKRHVLNSPELNSILLEDIQKCVSGGKSTLVLVGEIEHGKMLAEITNLPFASGENKESKELIAKLNDGLIPGLIATASLVGEGCDTRRVDALILANFAGSKGPFLQNLGRGLRKYPGKEQVLVVDYKPLGSKMLSRHADVRLKVVKELTKDVHYVKYESIKTRSRSD